MKISLTMTQLCNFIHRYRYHSLYSDGYNIKFKFNLNLGLVQVTSYQVK